MKPSIKEYLGALLLLAALSACSGGEQGGASLQWTPLATTAARIEVPAQAATAAPGDTVADVPGPVERAAVLSPAQGGQGPCLNDAQFLEDLTIPDGTQVAPGQLLVKRWSVQNSGSCDWGAGYRLMPMWDNPFMEEGEQGLYPARAGASAVWEVHLAAPQEAGTYFARWQAYAPDGTPFGEEVYLLIEVVAPTPTPTEAPE